MIYGWLACQAWVVSRMQEVCGQQHHTKRSFDLPKKKFFQFHDIDNTFDMSGHALEPKPSSTNVFNLLKKSFMVSMLTVALLLFASQA
jgi:hypothetical protein